MSLISILNRQLSSRHEECGHVASPRAGKWMSALLALAFLLSIGASAGRAQTTDSWNGGTGNWSVGSNWSVGVSPNNGGGNYYDVVIYSGGNDTVTLDTGSTIDTLTLGGASNGTLSILTDAGVAQQLTIGDPTAPGGDNVGILNNGVTGTINFFGGSTLTIDITGAGFSANVTESNFGNINLSGSTLALQDSGNMSAFTFTGGGTITLSNGSIVGVTGDEQMVNGLSPGDQLIQGSGLIKLDLINNDTVLANNGTLTLRPTGMSANPGVANALGGQMTVTSGNTMVWDTTQYQGTGLNAPGSAFNNASGGTVTVEDGGQMTWLAPNFASSGLPNSTSYFTNNGIINIGNNTSSAGSLVLSGQYATFDVGPYSVNGPTGTINLNSVYPGGNSSITGATGTELLINDTGNTISANGTASAAIFNLDLINNGTIVANGTGLAILPSGLSGQPAGFLNNGTLQDNGVIYLGGSADPGTSLLNPSFNNSSTGTVTVSDGDYLVLEAEFGPNEKAWFNNDGSITLGNLSNLELYGNGSSSSTFDLGSLSGLGSLTLNSSSIFGGFGNELFVNDTGHTIIADGFSSIYNLDFLNNGTVSVNDFLDISPSGLSSSPGVTNSSSGVMNVGGSGTMLWDATGGYPGTSLSAPAFNNQGMVAVADDGVLGLNAPNGTEAYFNNDGTINLGSGFGASLKLIGDGSTFDLGTNLGGGVLNLYGNSDIFGNYGTETLINDSNHYITDYGSSTISALTLINNGIISSQGGGTTTIQSDRNNNITNGVSGAMNIYSGSTLNWETNNNIGTSFFNYGTVNVNGGGTLEWSTGFSFSGSTVLISNDGTINIDPLFAPGTLLLSGNGITFDVFSGGGTGNIYLGVGGGFGSSIQGATGGELLINDTGNTITGEAGAASFIYNLDFTNKGTVVANGALDIQPTGLSVSPGVTNYGTMQVNGNSTLYWDATVYTGTSLSAPAFNNQGTVTVADNGFLELQAPVNGEAYFNNDGGITVGTSSGASLVLAGAGSTFDLGSEAARGSVTLNNSSISGFNDSELLINDFGHTIYANGSSYIYNLDLINYGLVDATMGSNLDLRPSGGSSSPGVINANGGEMRVETGAVLLWDTTNGFGGIGYLGTSPAAPAFNNQGTVTVSDGGYLELLAPNGTTAYFNNDGNINLLNLGHTTATSANLELVGAGSTFELGGTGTVTLNQTYLFGFTGTETLVNGAGQTIVANGSSPDSFIFSLNFTNNGMVTVNGSLVIQPGVNASTGVINNGAMQVNGTGILYWDTTNGFGSPGDLGTSLSAPAFNNQGTVTVNDGGYLVLLAPAGDTAYFNNDGTITVGSTTGANLDLSGNGSTFDLGSVRGTGSVTLNNSTIYGYDSTQILVNDTGHTIQGSGTIEDLTLVNKGTIDAGSIGGVPTANPLVTSVNSLTNNGAVNVDGGGLMVNGGMTNNETVDISTSMTVTGTLTNTGNITLTQPGASLTADLTNSGNIALNNNNQTLTDTGDLNNNGGALNISFADGSVRVAGNFVNNGGSLNISAADGSVRVASDFVNGAGGVGGTSLLPAVQLTGDHDSLTVGGTFTNDANVLVAMNGTNGSISVTGKFTNNGTINLGGSNNSLSADFDNSGPITLSGNGDSLTDLGDFNNNSPGSLSLTADSDQVTVATNLNNNAGASVTMSGTNGTLMAAVAFINGGTVTLSGSGDTLTAGSFTNTGTVSIGGNETVNLPAVQQPGTYTQTGGSTTVNGTLTAGGGVSLQGGSLLGAGRINGNVNNSGGSVEPASAPGVAGKLVINGSYTQGPSGTLIIDINALNSLSLLDVLGAGSLDGNVTFDFGFTPSAGETFTFLTAEAGNLAGVFASDTFNGFGCATCTLDYNYGNGSVTLDINGATATPEPSAWLMLGTALLAMAGYVLMQRRRAQRA